MNDAPFRSQNAGDGAGRFDNAAEQRSRTRLAVAGGLALATIVVPFEFFPVWVDAIASGFGSHPRPGNPWVMMRAMLAIGW